MPSHDHNAPQQKSSNWIGPRAGAPAAAPGMRTAAPPVFQLKGDTITVAGEKMEISEIYLELVRQEGFQRSQSLRMQLMRIASWGDQFDSIPEIGQNLVGLPGLGRTKGNQYQELEVANSGKPPGKSRNHANADIIIEKNGQSNELQIGMVTSGKNYEKGDPNFFRFLEDQAKVPKEEILVSKKDSEVELCFEIYNRIISELGEGNGRNISISIRIMSNKGPCDGCKDRIRTLKEKIMEKYPECTLELDIEYEEAPSSHKRKIHADNRFVNTEYGWRNDEQIGNNQKFYTHHEGSGFSYQQPQSQRESPQEPFSYPSEKTGNNIPYNSFEPYSTDLGAKNYNGMFPFNSANVVGAMYPYYNFMQPSRTNSQFSNMGFSSMKFPRRRR